MWQSSPGVKLEMRSLGGLPSEDDGVFYISWEDFSKHFDTVDVCVTSTGLEDLQMTTCEDYGACMGPTIGCVYGVWCGAELQFLLFLLVYAVPFLVGCIQYWACCTGLYKLWCSRESKADMDLQTFSASPGTAV